MNFPTRIVGVVPIELNGESQSFIITYTIQVQ